MTVPDSLLEALAAQEHTRWANWMRFLFECGESQGNGTFIIDARCVRRWRRQVKQEYSELAEPEKEQDRNEVRKTLALLASFPASSIEPGKSPR